MNVVLRVSGKVLQFAWKNRVWLIPIAREGYVILKRWIKLRKIKQKKSLAQ